MMTLLIAEKEAQDGSGADELGENPLAKYRFHSASNRARRREKIAVMRGSHAR